MHFNPSLTSHKVQTTSCVLFQWADCLTRHDASLPRNPGRFASSTCSSRATNTMTWRLSSMDAPPRSEFLSKRRQHASEFGSWKALSWRQWLNWSCSANHISPPRNPAVPPSKYCSVLQPKCVVRHCWRSEEESFAQERARNT